ncbi:MAG: glycosyltransferase family 4 protein [Gammaproteobacteria bacterium]|nr:glycosyltransferase family 4 protein [Gammaproteobacteria bacterium]MBT8109331.1 glycosyltransferase family 4 protein [Gammaproteobacteria bacterium]NNL44033.1 glycosyltransferase family 4 protein [Woeseiaceae bacterium]
MSDSELSSADILFRSNDCPEIALVTNHGYGGCEIPFGGAPDTGGQNLYVNTLAGKFEKLGYNVTIFARGGFPHFESDEMRHGVDYMSPQVRYVYVPGGGEIFIAKENISVALDDQLNWLFKFCQSEAETRGCQPWELYEFINTHYWDAAVLAVGLIERWRNLIVERSLTRLLSGVVTETTFEALRDGIHWRALGESPDFYLGRMLIYHVRLAERSIEQQVRAAASLWSSARSLDATVENRVVDHVMENLQRSDVHLDPRYRQLVAAAALGREILSQEPEVDANLKHELARSDRHVWTPHSLGDLKDFNYRHRSTAERRGLRFCERRNHERMICQRTHAFAATSAKIAERLWTHYHVPVEQTYYFPPCVDRDVFRAYTDEEKQETFRWLSEKTGLSEDELATKPLIFETSRMDRTKRKDLLLAAFAEIAATHPNCYLLIGGGPENDVFESLQKQLEITPLLKGRAFLLTAIPDEFIGPMFSVADIYASASEMEGFGMSVSQAASAGTPVVSTNTIPFSIHHAANEALLFDPGDMSGLVDALNRLLSDPAERARRGQEIEKTLEELDWTTRVRDFLAYLNRRGFEISPGRTA